MKFIARAVIGLLFCVGISAANAAETAPEETPFIKLLQNRDVLPLDKTKIRRIAVIGPMAERVFSYDEPSKTVVMMSPLQDIRNRAAAGTEIVYERGCALSHDAANSEHIQLLVGENSVTNRVYRTPTFGGNSLKLYADKAGDFLEFTVSVPKSGRYDITLQFDSEYGKSRTNGRGIYQLSIDGIKQGAPVDFYRLPSSYQHIADFGSKNFAFAGRKNFRFTAVGKNAESDSYEGHFDKLMLNGTQKLKFELENAEYITHGNDETASIARAVTIARTADVALVFVGSTEFVQLTGPDRGRYVNSLVLTGNQGQLVRAVLSANPRTVVVEISAEQLRAPWLKENAPALMQAWWQRADGGDAIAAALFGDSK